MILRNMTVTVKQCKISFPEQYRPGIFLLDTRKVRPSSIKFRLKKDTVTGSERTQQCRAYYKIVITCVTGSLPQSKYPLKLH